MKLSRLFRTSSDTATSVALLILRLGGGVLMSFHGWAKLTGFGERSASFPDPLGLGSPVSMGLAVFAEFFCALLLAAGLLSRLAVVPLIVTMAVGAFIIHAEDPLQKKELALLYLAVFVALLITGPGRFSFDSLLFKKR